MAGDWIKMRINLDDDPAVIEIADSLNIPETQVVGCLWKVWKWADSQTINGCARSATEKWIDRYVGVSGFAKAMVAVGWLNIENNGIEIPNFDRHNGKSAKQRALAQLRMLRSRCADVALPAQQKRNQRREENKDNTHKIRNTFSRPSVSEVAAYCSARANGIDAQKFIDHYDSNGWLVGKNPMKDWQAAVRTWERNKHFAAHGSFKGPRPMTTEEINNPACWDSLVN